MLGEHKHGTAQGVFPPYFAGVFPIEKFDVFFCELVHVCMLIIRNGINNF